MAYIKHSANPKNYTNDCIIRSIANATNTPWEKVMREMCDIAIEMYLMPNDMDVVSEYMYRRKVFAYSPERENTTVADFAKTHNKGRYVICCENHGVSIIDGDWYDIEDSAKDIVVDYYDVAEVNTGAYLG